MLMATTNQAYVFLIAVYVGIMTGLIYDVFRVIRYLSKPDKWITGLIDLTFWIIVIGLSFFVFYYTNYGEVRFYNFVGIALGWLLYAITLSRWIIIALKFIFKMLQKIFLICIKIISWPVQMPINMIKYIVNKYNILKIKRQKRRDKKVLHNKKILKEDE